MSLAKKLVRLASSVMTYAIVFFLLLLLAGLADLTPGLISHEAIPVFLAVLLGVPALAAAWSAKTLTRRWRSGPPGRSPSRGMQYLVAVVYALTAVFGVPAVLSQQNKWAIDTYKELRAQGGRGVWDAHPYIQAYVAIPVLPCLIVTYHEYQLAGLYGWGGFTFSVWYGVGVEPMGSLGLWVS